MSHEKKPAGTHFLTAQLKGLRFDGHLLPVETLLDFRLLRDLIAEVAKSIWRARNPGRARLPRGFEDGFHLGIGEIGEGSTTVELYRSQVGAQVLFPFADCFDQAAEKVLGAIERGAFEEDVDLGPKHGDLLRRLGSTLIEGEMMVLSHPGTQFRAELDLDRRKQIAFMSGASTYERRVEEVGVLVLASWEPQGCALRPRGGGKRIPVEVEDEDDIRRLAGLLGEKPLVRVVGTGRFNRQDRLVKIVQVEEIEPVEEESDLSPDQAEMMRQLVELERLPAGWFDGEGAALDAAGLQWVRRVLSELLQSHPGLRPYLYPTPEGDLQAEWTLGTWEASARFRLRERAVWLAAVDVAGDAESEEDVHPGEKAVGERIATFLGQLGLGEAA